MFFNEENINQRVKELKEKNQEVSDQMASILDQFSLTPEELEKGLTHGTDLNPNEKPAQKKIRKFKKRSHWIPV